MKCRVGLANVLFSLVFSLQLWQKELLLRQSVRAQPLPTGHSPGTSLTSTTAALRLLRRRPHRVPSGLCRSCLCLCKTADALCPHHCFGQPVPEGCYLLRREVFPLPVVLSWSYGIFFGCFLALVLQDSVNSSTLGSSTTIHDPSGMINLSQKNPQKVQQNMQVTGAPMILAEVIHNINSIRCSSTGNKYI